MRRLPGAHIWKTWLAAPVAVALIGISMGFAAVLESEASKAQSIAATDNRLAALGGIQEPGQTAQTVMPGPSAPVRSAADINDGRHVALVIGNARYPDDDASLKQPVNDARAVANELRDRGFEVVSGENLTKQGMEQAIDDFKSKVTLGATALIFYSGHGIQTGRQSYMIPVDAQIWREADVRRDGTSIEPLLAEIDARGVGTKLVIIDASRRNPFERRFRGLSIGLAPITVPEGTLVIYGAAPGKAVRDTDGANSVFVTELLTEMRLGRATAEDIFNHTRVSVARASQGERVPGVFSSMVEDFYFAQSRASATSRQSAR